MKKILDSIKKKINNQGSSIILVVVALAFIGILVGSLLTAVGYAYRLKLYDYNARDNFYYIEQAMDEIYAGIGNRTVVAMQDAYSDTVDNMVYFDLKKDSYDNIGNDAANLMFKEKFMSNIMSDSYFGSSIGTELEKCISNKTVVLDSSALKVVRYDQNGNVYNKNTTGAVLTKIVIKNVRLSRTEEYQRSSAADTFTQTISTDIVVGRPDFTVDFNSVNTDYNTIFNYAIVSDSGVEFNQSVSSPVTVNGNVYAAADYYNKDYNRLNGSSSLTLYKYTQTYNKESGAVTYSQANSNLADDSASVKYIIKTSDSTTETTTVSYQMNKVSSYTYLNNASGVSTNLANKYVMSQKGIVSTDYSILKANGALYDGVSEHSKYSGIYINGSKVSFMSDKIIVPGSISVMNAGNLAIYGKNGSNLVPTEVWADNVVLSGSSTKSANDVISSASATIRANLYVKDDLELNADNSSFKLIGSYYGFSDSTTKDDRSFIPTVDTSDFKYDTGKKDTSGNEIYEARDHFNSSSIVINGNNASLDLSNANTLFIAGRAYIELSEKTPENVQVDLTKEGASATGVTQTFEYLSGVKDFKTGESVSIKSNQLIYVPITTGNKGFEEKSDSNGTYYELILSDDISGSALFNKYFGTDGKVPCVQINVDGRYQYYYDFERAYAEDNAGYSKLDAFVEGFVKDYVAELNSTSSTIKDKLVDIRNYDGYDGTTVKLPDATGSANVYSSGALTVKDGTTFQITAPKETTVKTTLLNETATSVNVVNLSDTLEKRYLYNKWSLDDITSSAEQTLVSNVKLAKGEGYVSPLNKYMNFDSTHLNKYVVPRTSAVTGTTADNVLNLASGYEVYVSTGDLYVTSTATDKTIRGIIIAKGDVIFNSDTVTAFEGIIISGGKVYFNTDVTMISANPQLCQTIMKELMLDGSDNAKYVLKLFKNYEDAVSTAATSSSTATTIDTIDYSDVVRYENWMKNVE